jgi:hypothetical protein
MITPSLNWLVIQNKFFCTMTPKDLNVFHKIKFNCKIKEMKIFFFTVKKNISGNGPI